MPMRYKTDNTRIAVIGGGNIGTQFACVCASKGYEVNVFSSKPFLYDGSLEMIDDNKNKTIGVLNKVTSVLSEAVIDCHIIFITYPAFMYKNIADQLLPFVKKGVKIGVLPGTGGAEFAFRNCMKAGATIFGLQRVPSVARIELYGKRVRCEGFRSELYLASIPQNESEDLCELMRFLWNIPCVSLPNYLNVTLTPSNPILHTTRLKTLFSDYYKDKVYDRNPLFYGEWTDESSNLLLACDAELQEMVRIMDKIDLRFVKSLRLHYESDSAEALTNKIRSIKSLNHLSSPMKQVENGWIPDFNSRFFAADFPYGLAIIDELAELLNYNDSNIKDTMNWYYKVTGNTKCMELFEYGINSLEDIYNLY